MERFGKAADELCEPREEAAQFPGVAPETALPGTGHVMAQRFHERLVGNAEVFVAPAGQNDPARPSDGTRQLDGQAGLADPRFAGEERHPPLARHRLFPQSQEAFQLLVPAHEDSPRPHKHGRHGQHRLGKRLPHHLTDRHPGGQALQGGLGALGQSGGQTSSLAGQSLTPGATGSSGVGSTSFMGPYFVNPLSLGIPSSSGNSGSSGGMGSGKPSFGVPLYNASQTGTTGPTGATGTAGPQGATGSTGPAGPRNTP